MQSPQWAQRAISNKINNLDICEMTGTEFKSLTETTGENYSLCHALCKFFIFLLTFHYGSKLYPITRISACKPVTDFFTSLKNCR